MRITFLPKNIDGSGMYRCFFPAKAVEKHGHIMRSPAMAFFNAQGQQVGLQNGQLPDGWMNCVFGEWPDAEVFVFQMPLDESNPGLVQKLQGMGKKVVVELDDDFLHLPPYNPFNRTSTHLHKCVQMADAVIVSTPSLKSSYKHLNKNITVLPNRLNWDMWEAVTPVYEQSWQRTRIGYMGRLEYHTADLDVIRPWFSGWLARQEHCEFVAAGDSRVHSYLGVPVERRVSTDSTDFRHMELADITACFDIGLIPLAKNKFNEGKSYLKGLEYSACGIVPLATPSEQYRSFIREGVDGYQCDSKKAWIQALNRLVGQPGLRRSMGIAARDKARDFTYENHVGEWIDFFERVSPPKLLWDTGDSDNAVPAGAGIAA